MKTSESHPGNDARLHKWSIKPGTINKSVRVRENQRRHREKVRNNIAQLESELAQSREQLQDALSTIEQLRVELATANDRSNTAPAMRARTQRSEDALPDTAREHGRAAQNELKVHCCSRRSENASANPLLASTSIAEIRSNQSEQSYKDQYCTMKPPGNTASTIPCTDALKIVAENNHAGLDTAKIHQWLQPGYRRPSVSQNGCRVDNQLVFTLLDHITSASR